MSNGKADGLKKFGAPAVIFGSAAILLFVAWILWITHLARAQGAAITLVGVVTGHLIKEVQQLLRSWLRDDGPTGEALENHRNAADETTTPDK